MALLERVGTLLRANINDLIEKAEDPDRLAKQLVLDMENQLLQVKTQVAIAIADQHLLDRKLKEHQEAVQQWHRKAELAVEKQQDDLARAALARSLGHQQLATGFAQQLEDQTAETETLRNALTRLQQKLHETQAACEMLLARNRSARTTGKAGTGHVTTTVASQILGETLEDRFASLEKEDQINRLLEELKSRLPRLT
jgi:phage shock protein A